MNLIRWGLEVEISHLRSCGWTVAGRIWRLEDLGGFYGLTISRMDDLPELHILLVLDTKYNYPI